MVLSIFGGIPMLEAFDNKNTPGRLAFHLFNVTTMLAVSICFVVMAFRLTSLVGTWQQSDFPKQVYAAELTVARKFNTHFCETQSSYFCDRATLNELLVVNFGRVMMANKSAASVQTKEVAELCLERYGLNISEEAPSWGYICAYCVESETIESNEGFFNWTTDNCRPNTKTLSWCTTSLNVTDVASVITDSPFDVCRVPFLEHMHYWSRTFGGMVLGNAICLAVIFLCSCTLVRCNISCRLPIRKMPTDFNNMPLTLTLGYVDAVKMGELSAPRSNSITSETDVQSTGSTVYSSPPWYMSD